jgi:hypothetical protein
LREQYPLPFRRCPSSLSSHSSFFPPPWFPSTLPYPCSELNRASVVCAHICFAGIEDLREKREEICKTIREDEAEKARIQNDIAILTKRLSHVNESLARKIASRWERKKG